MDIPPDEVLLKEFDSLFFEHADGQHLFMHFEAKLFVYR
jgi:hypothetical protein